MGLTATAVPAESLVLVTGVNGFVASHIAKNLLRLGYKVRGTVRSEDKAAWIKEALAQGSSSSNFETKLVPDIRAEAAWSEVVEDVDGIVHVAGDMSFGADPNQVVSPMINSVRSLLEAADKSPSVKRFVLTSSNRAALNPTSGEDILVDTNTWNETAVKSAWRPPPYEVDRIWDVYAAGKTQVEQEVWKFKEEKKPDFVINSVLPCFVIGTILHEKQPGSSGKWVTDFWNDPGHYAPLQGFGPSWHTDADDSALLHIAALTQEDVKNERLFGWGESFNFNSWVRVFRELDPSKPWPADDPSQGHDLSRIDGKRELELLKRLGQEGWTSFHDSVKKNVQKIR